MIAIKGMEKPGNCFDCRFELRGWCTACEGNLPKVQSLDRPDWCPLVEAVTREDYVSMQQTCYKLQKALAKAAQHTNPEDSIREDNV